VLAGGFARLFGIQWSRHVLAAAAVAMLIGYPGYDTYAYTYLTAGVGGAWIFLMGWLVATPVPDIGAGNKRKARNATIGTTTAVVVAFIVHGWFVFGTETAASYAADLSVDLELGGETVTDEGRFRLTVGRYSTIRANGYIVDMIIRNVSSDEANMELRVFENLYGARGRKLTPCVDFDAPIGQLFGVGVSCGDLLIGLSGQLDPVD